MALADGLGVGTYAEGNWLVRLHWGSVACLAALLAWVTLQAPSPAAGAY